MRLQPITRRRSGGARLLVRDHPLDLAQVGLIKHDVLIEVALALGVLRRQDVTCEGVTALDLAGGGLLEALGGAGMRFEFLPAGRDLAAGGRKFLFTRINTALSFTLYALR